MQNIKTKNREIDWAKFADEVNIKGYSIIPKFLTNELSEELKNLYEKSDLYRKTVVMERHQFGLGEYKYFNYPLPEFIENIRSKIYCKLNPIANTWFKLLKIEKIFPETHEEFLNECRANNQNKPTALILRYDKGGYNTLHQDLYGDVYFPIQIVLFLNEPDVDYQGGEFVLVQQTPRAQSKAIVLKPKKGDLLAFATNFRPVKGKSGYFRTNMKHGVSEIHEGERHTVGIIFHDALN